MIVPAGRESDWLFPAEFGHLHLLLTSPRPRLSRLVLAGAPPGDIPRYRFARNAASCDRNGAELALAESLRLLFLSLSPKLCFAGEFLPEIPVLSYEDGVVSGKVLGVFIGALAGEMLVEDVEIETVEGEGKEREFRRRLRFKRMPNLIQTQVRIVGFRPELRVLVQPYLAPMAASLGLIGGHIGERILTGARLKALCLGVEGGAICPLL